MNAENKNRIVFMGKISKTGNKYVIIIPRKLYLMVQHGKKYIVTLSEVGEGETK